MKNIGTRLKNAIKISNFTQKEIAELINTSQNALSSYMQGKASITVETLRNICDIINVPIQDIVYGVTVNDLDDLILNKLNRLSDEQKNEIIGHIEYLENKNKQMSSTYGNTKEENIANKDTG